MEYVEVKDLYEVWSALSIFGELRVIWQLRSYVSQLRRIPYYPADRPIIPGPLDGTEVPLKCYGHYFTEWAFRVV